ncbi:hypothetical protein GFS24_09730 [Chitinophaga sp. SYP-B3965]|uniref:DUF1801 domain-containing protein n=1 Tax=Chitinophaga sp. SYP-B3965 TaxID=2663120 RepID=UPI00129A04C7|nr:YdeI/OmpD-associated family protein [Chitinophaga sp. SYP-B3965]MRG45396.1 hypothetical protein [Chitinophaga sp. SYP-B3965]
MKKVDAYIAKSAPFAQPILEYLREIVHKACPHAEETIKWGMPIFETYGTNLCNMAAFKQHCAFGFWKASLLEDKQGILDTENAMGSLGRITSLKDLPSEKILISYLKEADGLNRDNIKVPKAAKEKKELVTPAELAAALKKNKAAAKVFEDFSYSCRKEYIEWIDEAKTEATKLKRADTAVEWMAEGKDRNWKYKK